MKRFLTFGFDNYYPGGGWNDFEGAYDTKEEAFAARRPGLQFYQVIDTHTMREVSPS